MVVGGRRPEGVLRHAPVSPSRTVLDICHPTIASSDVGYPAHYSPPGGGSPI